VNFPPAGATKSTKEIVMTTANRFLLATAVCALLAPAVAAFADLPAGWFKAGSHPMEYDMGLDESVRRDGKSSATVKSTAEKPQGFGTLMQITQPGDYRGKRVRLSGFVKSDKVTQWAGLWFRIDGPTPNVSLGFDNMQDRAIKGTTDWTRYELVLDVPQEAQRLAFGILLAGAGQVWMDDLKFEVVPTTVKTTNMAPPAPPAAPTNLNFEK
jgi:hypothetical protein